MGKTGCHVYHPPVITSFIGGISLPFPVLVFSEFFKVDLSKSSQFLQKSEGFKESDWAEYNFICHLLPGYIYIYTLHYAALCCIILLKYQLKYQPDQGFFIRDLARSEIVSRTNLPILNVHAEKTSHFAKQFGTLRPKVLLLHHPSEI